MILVTAKLNVIAINYPVAGCAVSNNPCLIAKICTRENPVCKIDVITGNSTTKGTFNLRQFSDS